MKCNFCKTSILKPTFDLGNTAISNDLISASGIYDKEITYPLLFYICPECMLAQTKQFQKEDDIFRDDYVYFSSCSSYWLKHASDYVDKITKKLKLNKSSFVIEVASNDGYLLTNFLDKNIKCLGIEPTKSTAIEAMKKGVPTLVDFFGSELSYKLIEKESKADLVIANNVLAHVPDINDFISGLKNILNDNGTITVEIPHLLNLVKKNEFDTIYHEHFFYFSLISLSNIFNKFNMSIYDVEEFDTHGGSIRIYIANKNSSVCQKSNKKNVNSILKKEIDAGMNEIDFYKSIGIQAYHIKLNSLNYLIDQKINNKKIVAFGAAAKGNTFLNYCGIKKDIIDFVVDETPYKIGKYLPQSKIPIVRFEEISNKRPDVIIILPWNHKNEIVDKLKFTQDWECEIVTFIPKFEIIRM